ncbi:MAG: protein-ADP-ribose hydrolase [Bacteroidales bacterium]|nr:protein-ADP-ribose hydrolase [Bacteroidales bacterium]
MDRLANLDLTIRLLMQEQHVEHPLPSRLPEKQRLMRALLNTRPPLPASSTLLEAQDRELQQQTVDRGVVEISEEGVCLWQGDITRLRVDAIVNAANSQLLGCWHPLHACIDNCIHSAAGLQLRCECHDLMQQQGHPEPTGQAKITQAYNLPARHVIHTVGPIIEDGHPTPQQRNLLASCYQACLDLAESHSLRSIAFCCISTGVFGYPNREAAEVAIQTVRAYPRRSVRTVVFNVFKNIDYAIYQQLLCPTAAPAAAAIRC